MLRLYIDENSHSHALIGALRRAGFDCLTVNEAKLRGATDEEQLLFATRENRTIHTCDIKDFRPLDETWRTAGRHHAGIILLTDQRTPIGVQLRCLNRLVDELRGESMTDRLEFLLAYR